MKQIRDIMGMPIQVEVLDSQVTEQDIEKVWEHFRHVDEKFSTYKSTSEITHINEGKIKLEQYSQEMKEVMDLCKKTQRETQGFFNIEHNGKLDPSGIVKGWAIYNASQLLKQNGLHNFFIDAGGDIQVSGKNKEGKEWIVGIRNPFKPEENIKVLHLTDKGIATSGTSERGQHIYNPYSPKEKITDVVSLTVIGLNVYEADRFATAAFAMGKEGIHFIQSLPGFEGYMIDAQGIATFTSNFEEFTQ
jgi:thiamine biosynthesis lipoprotein